MLKLTPRYITSAIGLFFAGLLGLQFFIFDSASNFNSERSLNYFLYNNFHLLVWVDRLDYDIHLRLKDLKAPHESVRIVEINERSMQRLGQFPFSRKIYKTFLEKLEAAGAKVVAFDITFPERERNSTLEELSEIREKLLQQQGFDSAAAKLVQDKISALDSDQDFSLALSRAKLPVVLGFAFSNVDAASLGIDVSASAAAMQRFSLNSAVGGVEVLSSPLQSKSENIPILPHRDLLDSLNGNSSIGAFTAAADDDSVIRRALGAINYQGKSYASLAVLSVAKYLGINPAITHRGGLKVVDSSGQSQFSVPLQKSGDFLLNYYGGDRIFPYFEFVDVLDGQLPANTFAGKIVFVGVTAEGLKDIRATPFSRDYPGVEVHATLASNILNNEYMQKDFRFIQWGALLLLAGIVLGGLAVYRLHPLAALFTMLALVVCCQLIVQFLFFNRGIVVPSFLPSIAYLSVFFSGVVYRYFSEEREKQMVRTAFSRYVSGAVVAEILKDHTKLRLGGQKKELTVMFVDLVGFTKISEHLDAGFVTQLLNEYFTRMTRIILKNQGTLDKYMGDGIMCFWGAPLDIPEHARLACQTALEMRAELVLINSEWQEKYRISIENRIGIHSGDMAVGNMGSEQVFSYTVMGDNVNLASRLEGINTIYGTHVIASARTVERAGGGFLFRPLDCVQVKGKDDSIEICELTGPAEAKEPEWVHTFRVGLAHYRAGEWDEADAAFGACLALKPNDFPSQLFRERIRDFRIVEPENWNGTWRMTSK